MQHPGRKGRSEGSNPDVVHLRHVFVVRHHDPAMHVIFRIGDAD
jgi:hypothetical protein